MADQTVPQPPSEDQVAFADQILEDDIEIQVDDDAQAAVQVDAVVAGELGQDEPEPALSQSAAAEQAVEEAAEQAVQEAAKEAVQEAVQEAAEEAVAEAVVEAVEEAVEAVECATDAIETAAEQAVEEAVEAAAVATQQAIEEAESEALQQAAEQAIEEALIEEAAEEAEEEAMHQAAEQAIEEALIEQAVEEAAEEEREAVQQAVQDVAEAIKEATEQAIQQAAVEAIANVIAEETVMIQQAIHEAEEALSEGQVVQSVTDALLDDAAGQIIQDTLDKLDSMEQHRIQQISSVVEGLAAEAVENALANNDAVRTAVVHAAHDVERVVKASAHHLTHVQESSAIHLEEARQLADAVDILVDHIPQSVADDGEIKRAMIHAVMHQAIVGDAVLQANHDVSHAQERGMHNLETAVQAAVQEVEELLKPNLMQGVVIQGHLDAATRQAIQSAVNHAVDDAVEDAIISHVAVDLVEEKMQHISLGSDEEGNGSNYGDAVDDDEEEEEEEGEEEADDDEDDEEAEEEQGDKVARTIEVAAALTAAPIAAVTSLYKWITGTVKDLVSPPHWEWKSDEGFRPYLPADSKLIEYAYKAFRSDRSKQKANILASFGEIIIDFGAQTQAMAATPDRRRQIDRRPNWSEASPEY